MTAGDGERAPAVAAEAEDDLRGSDALGLVARSHPLRASLAYEMHLRHLPRFAAPARLLQVVTLLGEGDAAASRAQVDALRPPGAPPLPPDAKHAAIALGAQTLVWERHSEFATYTLVDESGFATPFDAPFDTAAFTAARAVIAAIPGRVIRATHIALLARDADDPDPALIARSFAADALVACDVAEGRARIWSDFQLHGDGLGRLLIADRGLDGGEAARLVQRLQELGNYRNMALLGLPVAQALAPEVTRLEARLAALTAHFADPKIADDPLLEELTDLSAELARLLAETRYRMSATRAYAQISADRLANLEVRALPGHQTLTDFTDRRLVPAVRTCDSFLARLEELSQRASWTSGLLRTRIDTALARQNRDLLETMNRRTHLQLRLQQAVEGLSVVAISYYLVALIGYVALALPVKHDLVVAIAAPLALIGCALVFARVKRGLRRSNSRQEPDRLRWKRFALPPMA